jgi:uncharacterized membrane protein YphA (DoxX/SURF4 family)
MRSTKRLSDAAPVAMRMALAAGFLSAVADRFGLWGPIGKPGVSWGGFAKFLDYTATLLPFLPTTLVAVAGRAATVAETLLGVALLAGVRVRLAALASGVLLLTFAIAMTTALGPEAPLSYSVWTAAAGAFLLARDQPAASRALHSREKPSTEVAFSGIPSGPVSTCHSR